ncbi:uncharacterized protein [Anabrus simplex]|uniref:uncharacterized protein n=1 Tax=Anabrus simplex TaxID=316456 RepID=UPI0035A3010E
MNEQIANIKFVEEVEKHPELYNYQLSGYSIKDRTEKAWSEVAKEVKMTVTECKEKWRNLRTVFIRHMKPSPTGTGSKKKRAYYLAEAMQFALPFIKTLNPPATGNVPQMHQEMYQDVFQDETEAFNNPENKQSSFQETRYLLTQSPPLSPPPLPESFAAPLQADNIAGKTVKSSPLPQQKRKVTPKQRPETDALQSFIDYFKAKRARLDATAVQRSDKINRREALKMFLLSLMPELEEFNDHQLKLFKRRTLSLIDDIASNQTGNTSTPPCTFSPASTILLMSRQPSTMSS